MKYFFLVLVTLASCSAPNTDWYEKNTCADIDIIPLIRPYLLSSVDAQSWSFSFIRNSELDECGISYGEAMYVSRINVKGDLIYGYCEKSSDYFIVIPSKKYEKKFDSKEAWILYLKDLHHDTGMLYNVYDLYVLYNNHSTSRHGSYYGYYKKLPWYRDIKNTIE